MIEIGVGWGEGGVGGGRGGVGVKETAERTETANEGNS